MQLEMQVLVSLLRWREIVALFVQVDEQRWVAGSANRVSGQIYTHTFRVVSANSPRQTGTQVLDSLFA